MRAVFVAIDLVDVAQVQPVMPTSLAIGLDGSIFELDGKRNHHTLDPRSGQPVTHWRSGNAFAPLAVVAGYCATFEMLKQSDGLAFLAACGMNYLAVDQSGTVHVKRAVQA